MSYDLVLADGHLIDPACGIDGPADIAFKDGRVAAVGQGLASADAREIRSAAGFHVVPGLIDLHAHVYWGGTYFGVDADTVARGSGMTTAVDAGSAGAGNLRGLIELVGTRTAVRILAFVNLAFPGIFSDSHRLAVGEAEDLRLLDIRYCVEALKRWRDHAVGIKIRVGGSSTKDLGAMPLHMAIRASELAGGVPVMAHVGADMPPRLDDIVDPLRPGDIVTHCCTPKMNRPITSKGQLRDCMQAARARGVIMDVGHGAGSFGFDIGRAMLDLGFAPDVISSDVHATSVDGPAYDVLVTMSKFLCLGLPLADVVRAATAAPAAAMRRADIGTLAPGAVGDAVLLEIARGPVLYRDSVGGELRDDRRLVPRGIVLAGRWWDDGRAPVLPRG
jgi:dihydroorotase